MKNIRLLVPVGLFLAFAFAHRMANSINQTYFLVKVVKDLEKDHQLKATDLEPVTVSCRRNTDLSQTFAQFVDRKESVVYGKINRRMSRGELVSLRDLQQAEEFAPSLEKGEYAVHIPIDRLNFAGGQLYVGIKIGFLLEKRTPFDGHPPRPGGKSKESAMEEPVPLGPFKVVGIGDRVSELSDATESRSHARVLTIAAKLNTQGTGFESDVMRLLRAAQDKDSADERIMALVIWPREE